MTKAYYSTVLDYPLATVWSLIRDFNNYPAYIEGVTASVIEDDKEPRIVDVDYRDIDDDLMLKEREK